MRASKFVWQHRQPYIKTSLRVSYRGLNKEQSSKLLLVLASTVVLGFEPLRNPRPNLCSDSSKEHK
jgi:hypothetical protein